MTTLSKGTIYRCSKKECGAEVQVVEPCHCGDECHLTCCGEKMQQR